MKNFGSVFERDHRCVTSIVKYRNCIVDFGRGKTVHHPELNACFLKNNYECNVTHFGYAIPISVLPIDNNSRLAKLVFDGTQDLDPIVAEYLLQNHPDLKVTRKGTSLEEDAIADLTNNFRDFTEQFIQDEGSVDEKMKKMATTANHDHMRSFPEPEEDIAAIAKQISDHAEAIYQNWKSRGLAPTEILKCHGNATAADNFESTLTPKTRNPEAAEIGPDQSDILADPNKLERLVNNFVVEDKARVAATRNVKPLVKSNTIQYALQKFEKNSMQKSGTSGNRLGSSNSGSPSSFRTLPQPTQISRPVPANQINLQSLDTIEVVLPEEIVHKNAAPLQKRGGAMEFEGANAGSTGIATWPLKNKTIRQDTMKIRRDSLKTSPKNSDEFLNEVQREEERLINALKCGVIINDESSGKETEEETVKKSCLQEKMLLPAPGSGNDIADERVTSKSVSLVGCAKNKYKSAPQNHNAVEVDQKITIQNHEISVIKNRFEDVSSKKVDVSSRNKETNEWVGDEEGDKNRIPSKGNLKNRVGSSENVPHPELTSQQKQHIRQAGTNPIRPFLTRGSVAERVLIFEKCPTELLLDKRKTSSGLTGWRTGADVQPKPQTYSKDKEKENQRPGRSLHTTLQRQAKASKNVFVPRFYFPQGKPQSQQHIESVLQKLAAEFRTFPMAQIPQEKFHVVVKACECPLYWKIPLFVAAGGEKLGYVDAHSFLEFWKELASTYHDSASKFLRILVRNEGRNFLLPEDFIPLIQDVVDTHPGLVFLKEAIEFHSRYIHTVIARIFYCVNRSWSGRITLPELRRSNLLQIISLLEEEEDINQITQYFSYEHFYVIYCKFWELDRDHDLFIDRQDLTRHNDHALSSRMIDRIFSGAVTRGGKSTQDKMSYMEFVWFLLSEEDKQHPTAIEYWFRCMDLDGDGYLSMYELEYFYEEQLQRMELLGIATLPFEDCLCQMLDMIHPQNEGKISLVDLKRCKMVTIFFDTFFNLEKYLDHEQRDPFASQRDHDADGDVTDWDRYAAEEYEILVAEEEGNDHPDDLMLEDEM